MTREEAIEVLKKIQRGMIAPSEHTDAIDMAIKALQAKTDGDLISRSDAIDALGEEPEIWNDTEEEWAYRNAWVEHISAIKSLPSAEPKTGWIPVSERLPENSGCVLISIAGDIEFGAYDRQNNDWAIWRDGYWDEGKRADAWMPLPEPYREDGAEE